MKNIFRFFVLTIAMITFCVSTYAQKNGQQRITREQLAEAQANFIADKMEMNDTVTKQFIETFCQFQKDIWALGPRPKREFSHLSDQEAEQAMNERFDHSQKILDLRKKYYVEYSRFLTHKQIERVYELEKRIMNRLYHRSRDKENQE